jgi:hypothetical protein
MAMSLQQEVVHLREQVAQLLAINAQLRQQIDRQQLQIDRLIKMTFGRKSDRVEGPTLFDDLLDDPSPNPSDTPAPPDEPIVLVPKRKGHGRKKNSADLPRQREELPLSEAQKACPCCSAARFRIGETTRERLDFTPRVDLRAGAGSADPGLPGLRAGRTRSVVRQARVPRRAGAQVGRGGWAAGPGAGVQVCRSSAAQPPGVDLHPAGWLSLGRYLGDARFSIDNNGAERAVRPLAISRKN